MPRSGLVTHGMRRKGLRSGVACMLMTFAVPCEADTAATDGMFRWTIATTLEIDAPPSVVWNVLVDLPAYRDWNPFIVEASGHVAVGQRLSLRMALPGWKPTTITPRLLVVDPERELRWKGRLLVPGLFDGEHAFVLTALGDGRTRMDHWERFAGLLLPIARPLIFDGTARAFDALNDALATRAAARGRR